MRSNPARQFPADTVGTPLARPAAVALGRAAAGGVSLLVAIALAVNLTCRAAGPMLGSMGDGSHERQTLRQLTLAIHRVVRRLMGTERRRRKSESGSFSRGAVERRAVGAWLSRDWRSRPSPPMAHLISLPPPRA